MENIFARGGNTVTGSPAHPAGTHPLAAKRICYIWAKQMKPLLTCEEMRRSERFVINELSIPEIILMEHAAMGVANAVMERFSGLLCETRGLIVAGSGNNGADALAAARILYNRGCRQISVCSVGDHPKSSLHKAQGNILSKMGIQFETLHQDLVLSSDWIIDGLFGTGLSRDPAGEEEKAIDLINQNGRGKWIVAVDIPSGLNTDTGQPFKNAVRASETVTFGFIKKGLVTGEASDCVGRLRLVDIQIPRDIPSVQPAAFLYEEEDARELPHRSRSGHKGDYGHVFVMSGAQSKLGASEIAALGALRVGAGLVTLIQDGNLPRPSHLPLEIMMATREALQIAPKRTCLVVGPGLEIHEAGVEALKTSLNFEGPLVIDADALNILSEKGESLGFQKLRKGRVTMLTPHPKEAARLLKSTVEIINRDRYRTILELSHKFDCSVVLKGRGTLIQSPGQPTLVVNNGDSGLSKGGTGDLLSGILAGLLAQSLPVEKALPLGVYIHGKASEYITARYGHTHSTLTTEIASQVPWVLKDLL